jgi:hypothetical protein
MKAPSEHAILVGGQLTDTSAVRAKVEQDIAFLTGRITTMEKHPRPNKIVLDTYKGMLKSRVAVLKWLLHGNEEDEAGITYISQQSA